MCYSPTQLLMSTLLGRSESYDELTILRPNRTLGHKTLLGGTLPTALQQSAKIVWITSIKIAPDSVSSTAAGTALSAKTLAKCSNRHSVDGLHNLVRVDDCTGFRSTKLVLEGQQGPGQKMGVIGRKELNLLPFKFGDVGVQVSFDSRSHQVI